MLYFMLRWLLLHILKKTGKVNFFFLFKFNLPLHVIEKL